jgi:ketosteroid isomerase-like protein
MKTILMVSLFAVFALALAGCQPAANTNTNATNTNVNSAPKAAAPTADALMALDNKAWEAYKNKDGKYFEGFLGDTMISGTGEAPMARADVVKMISENKEEIKSFALSEPRVTPVGADAAVLTYKATVEGTDNGKPLPSPLTVATVFVRSGTDWKAIYHNEVAIVDAAKTGGDANKKDASAPAANDKKDTATAAATGDEKKESAAPAAGNSNSTATSNSNSNSNSAASSGDAALTDALLTVERKGWEGWKAKDATALGQTVSKDIVFVDSMGKVSSGADVMKMWTTDNPCNVSSVSLSDAKGTSISKDAAILVYKGTAVGTCGDMKLEPLWGTTVFVKEGDAWKGAYIFESPIRKM